MKRVKIIPVVMSVSCMLLTQNLGAQMHASQATMKSKKAKIQSAMSAAPKAITKDATILDYPAKEGDQPAVLRKGTNGWTCFPDDPNSPGNDPMCLDKMGMAWFEALMMKTEPKLTAPGLSYMLQGGSDASNADPFATQPPSGAHWVTSPPHLMLIPTGKLDPTIFSSDPRSGGPWIMWGGTPYEHLMVPVK
ncbi:MAG TPA: hypothetical protein VLQ80_30125 [Candidatus Saccharimonadia bacterium]|nr:hypothetical protein [Candidatus Saccharimonadia bacterium]